MSAHGVMNTGSIFGAQRLIAIKEYTAAISQPGFFSECFPMYLRNAGRPTQARLDIINSGHINSQNLYQDFVEPVVLISNWWV
jgi:hypothetical protein